MNRALPAFGTTLLVCFLAPAAVLAGEEKVAVCHLDADSGTYHLININDRAFPAHIEHGDGSPGDPVPGKDGYEFGPNCEVESVIWCPTEGTLTDTLGSHNFWFSVNGAPHGYTGTNESWIWWFNWGVFWDKFYGGDYLEFCVDADCSAPYGCFVPLAQ